MIGTIIACLFIGFLIGMFYGGIMGVDSCSKDINDSVILEHIKKCIFKDEISNEDKINFTKDILLNNTYGN